MSELVPYQDYKPFPVKINGESVLVFRDDEMRREYSKHHPNVPVSQLGKLGVALFWANSDYDYMGVSRFDNHGDEHWTLDFDKPELITWIAGFALNRDRQRMLHLAQREHGSFFDNYGWRPQVVVDDVPSESESENYIQFLMERDLKDDELVFPEEASDE